MFARTAVMLATICTMMTFNNAMRTPHGPNAVGRRGFVAAAAATALTGFTPSSEASKDRHVPQELRTFGALHCSLLAMITLLSFLDVNSSPLHITCDASVDECYSELKALSKGQLLDIIESSTRKPPTTTSTAFKHSALAPAPTSTPMPVIAGKGEKVDWAA